MSFCSCLIFMDMCDRFDLPIHTGVPIYFRYRYETHTRRYAQCFNPCEEALEGNQHVAYRCKKCRRIVALKENVVSHVPGEGETCFEWQKRKAGNQANSFREQQ
ncbi:hypothetical protein GW17_00027181 [Ensete ventricosum]|nr:hypothetical protein GW17_00027181 [Ensete ventricosum]